GVSESLGRLFTISFYQSTFVGRLLYYRDSFSLIISHPFGLGYMGYGYLHQSVQTGVYSVMYVHNDFLQLMLDIGWVPALLLLSAIVSFLLRRGASFEKKLLVCVIALHSMFDFDLQFVSVFMLLVMLMFKNEDKERFLTSRFITCAVCALLASANAYFGTALMLSRFGGRNTAQTLMPFNTQNELQLLMLEKNLPEANRIADDIISRNTSVKQAYVYKAYYAYSKGDIGKAIEYYENFFSLSPFDTDAYNEYCRILITGIGLYEKAGDEKSAEFCRQKLKNAAQTVHGLNEKLSELGKMIDDQPVTTLSDDVEEYLKTLK
ncbi:MAG: O-antigen ligase family protein, partial [Clostridia bacterium]|nr:O-antigen ligase family protein [Clostridia bacterium]